MAFTHTEVFILYSREERKGSKMDDADSDADTDIDNFINDD